MSTETEPSHATQVDAPRLDYAPPPPLHKRKAARRVVLVVVGFALVLLGLKLGPVVWHRVQLVYWQDRCLDYRPADGQVALQMDYVNGRWQSTGTVPAEWSRFYFLLSPPGVASGGTAFLGRVRTPGGDERLLVADVDVGDITYWNEAMARLEHKTIGLNVRMFEPGSVVRPPREMPVTTFNKRLSKLPNVVAESAKVSVGRRDAKDASHVVVEFATDGRKGAFDVWVTGDNTVVVEDSVSDEKQQHPPFLP